MSPQANGNAQRKSPLPLTLIDQGDEDIEEDSQYIVLGESGDDIAFELCEDLQIAIGVRDAMNEDGFQVRVFQAIEVDIVDEDETESESV